MSIVVLCQRGLATEGGLCLAVHMVIVGQRLQCAHAQRDLAHQIYILGRCSNMVAGRLLLRMRVRGHGGVMLRDMAG